MAVTWYTNRKTANVTLSNGNLTASTTASSAEGVRAFARDTGLHYMELTVNTIGGNATSFLFGLKFETDIVNGSFTTGFFYRSDGNVYKDNVVVGTYVGYTDGDVLGMAVDLDAGCIWFHKNGTWIVGSPITRTSPAITYDPVGSVYLEPALVFNAVAGTKTGIGNFLGPFAYTIPTGYRPWEYIQPTGTARVTKVGLEVLTQIPFDDTTRVSNFGVNVLAVMPVQPNVRVSNFGLQALVVVPDTKLDLLNKTSNAVLTNALRSITATANVTATARATRFKETGKWYWETTETSPHASGWTYASGIVNSDFILGSPGSFPYASGNAYSGPGQNGNFYNNNQILGSYGSTKASGAVVRHLLDLDNDTYQVAINGGSIVTVATALPNSQWYPIGFVSHITTTDQINFNFGANTFTYSVPVGFTAYGQLI